MWWRLDLAYSMVEALDLDSINDVTLRQARFTYVGDGLRTSKLSHCITTNQPMLAFRLSGVDWIEYRGPSDWLRRSAFARVLPSNSVQSRTTGDVPYLWNEFLMKSYTYFIVLTVA